MVGMLSILITILSLISTFCTCQTQQSNLLICLQSFNLLAIRMETAKRSFYDSHEKRFSIVTHCTLT